jgi:hypothetical protein
MQTNSQAIEGVFPMYNLDIREEIKAAGLKLWQIAQQLNITDGNFSRKLRTEFSDEQK